MKSDILLEAFLPKSALMRARPLKCGRGQDVCWQTRVEALDPSSCDRRKAPKDLIAITTELEGIEVSKGHEGDPSLDGCLIHSELSFDDRTPLIFTGGHVVGSRLPLRRHDRPISR